MTLPPDPDNLNNDRAEWAGDAVAAFMSTTGTELENVLSDLLCDLMHWADRREECFQTALQLARWHYAQETNANQTITPTQAMNIIKARKSRGAVCPRCTHPDYTMRPPIDGETTRPMFQCSACGHTWTYGQSGGRMRNLPPSSPTGGRG